MYGHSEHFLNSMSLPQQVDLRPLLNSVRDQGQRETCLAFATTATHEAKRLQAAPCDPLCVEMLYWKFLQLGGSYFSSAVTALSQTGQPPESMWPYDEFCDENAPAYSPPNAALSSSPFLCANLAQTKIDATTIKNHINQKQPVILGLPLCESFHYCTDGSLTLPTLQDLLLGAHAVVAVGYDDTSGAGVLVIRNSWGKEWGDAGHAYLPYDYLQGVRCVKGN